MSAMSLHIQFLHLISQFCGEEKYQKTKHVLEEETGFYFDREYFEELIMNGKWDEAEKYLSGFTSVDANEYSLKIYFEMRKQKLLEALDKDDRHKGLEILMNDLKIFASSNEELYKELTTLITMDDFRKHQSLASYGDIISGRKRAVDEIKPLIVSNPHLREKIELPEMDKSRLRQIVNQSLNWQHSKCAHNESRPQIQSLYFDHRCPPQRNQTSQSSVEKALILPQQQIEAGNSGSVLRIRDRDNNTPSTSMECIPDSHNIPTSSSSMSLDKMVVLNSNIPGPSQINLDSDNADEFPKTVQRCTAVEFPPTSMDFHPVKETVLLVGSINGGIELWDVTTQSELEKDPHISVKRVLWSPYGSLFGVAFSKHIVQVYSYNAISNFIEKHLEIDAHVGAVNDLAFSAPSDQLYIITAGDDNVVQVWSTLNGSKLYTFQGHTGPVFSVCSHIKEDINFVFSTSVNGEIRAWLYHETGPSVEYDAPGHSCVRMTYSADGKRLFSGGTNKEGESFLVEWNETDGFITRSYHGLAKPCAGILQYRTCKNRFLVAGDDHFLKVWDMDNVGILTIVGATESLSANPYLCFSKNDNLLAVFTEDSKIKIFANEAGIQILKNSASSSVVDANGILSKSLQMDLCTRPAISSCVSLHQLLNKNSSKVYSVSTCQSLRLPSDVRTNQICRLVYTNSGNALLALAADGVHLLWKWSANEHNKHGKLPQATAKHSPQLWQPRSGLAMFTEARGGLAMINELADDPFQLVTHCFAISKNDSYLVSASGKMVSLFNMMTFERLRSCLQPPPTATCLAFYPADNNVVAIGLDDSTILIYNVRLAQLTYRLSGHTKRITGLAFSNALKVLISASVDTQIFMWDCLAWQQKKSTALQINVAWLPSETSEITLQFHRDQKHFLVVHETQLAIYEAVNLERVMQWTIGDFCGRISNGAFSCDNQVVYTIMKDGNVMIFCAANLVPKLLIDPSVYLPPNISCGVYPLAIAAHPQKPEQFAMGLSNGAVIVVEPEQFGGKWITMPPPADNGIGNNRIIID